MTDCLACSGCVTSAEAILVSLQSHSEVLNALDSHPSLHLSSSQDLSPNDVASAGNGYQTGQEAYEKKVFVASVSPQVRASLAAAYNVSQLEAGWIIDHLLNGPQGLPSGGKYGNGFTWIVDTNAMREASLVLGSDEVVDLLQDVETSMPSSGYDAESNLHKKPILSSACPGWICYAEKTHPHVLPHLSRLKSPQALTGTLLKTVLSSRLGIRPDQIWHVAIMPCFDKKLEASREELTDIYWRPSSTPDPAPPVRDVDCVITTRELLMLADTRGISFPALPRYPLPQSSQVPFPDPILSSFLFPYNHLHTSSQNQDFASIRAQQTPAAGTSGGYLHHILATQHALHPNSAIQTARGRNADVIEYTVQQDNTVFFKAARYYGFRNIQNLVRKLKPPKTSKLQASRGGARVKPSSRAGGGLDYAYVEVMACPGGCTNGGGQTKAEDIDSTLSSTNNQAQKEWLAKVDEAYFSMEEDDDPTPPSSSSINLEAEGHEPHDRLLINGISPPHIRSLVQHWADLVGIPTEKLVKTAYRVVVSDVGRGTAGQTERVSELAAKIGGGW